MAVEAPLGLFSWPASADLHTNQFCFVTVNSSGQVAVNGTSGADCVGVLQNKPDVAGQGATVAVGGISKVVAGGTITPGAEVMSDTSGHAIAATAGNYQLGRYVGTASCASGDIISVLLRPAGKQ